MGSFEALVELVEIDELVANSNLKYIAEVESLYDFDMFSSSIFYAFVCIGTLTIISLLWGESQDTVDLTLKNTLYNKHSGVGLDLHLKEKGMKEKHLPLKIVPKKSKRRPSVN